MRRLLFALLLCLGLAGAAATAQAPRDWRTQTVRAPSGAFVVGRPGAPLLVEWLSYTCPHCGHFIAESKLPLDALVRAGKLRIEYRTLPRDPLDMAAGLLVRCTGPARFHGSHALVFANQDRLISRAAAAPGVAASADPAAQLRAVAQASGLSALMRTRGLTDARIAQCLGNKAEIATLTAIRQAAVARIQGTPSFEINGQLLSASGWGELQPLLRQRGIQ